MSHRLSSLVIVLIAVVAIVVPGCRAEPAPSAAADASAQGAGGGPATAAWGRVLSKYHHSGGLDYAGLKADRGDLDTYLQSLAGARPKAMGKSDAAAFWINAYNAVVAHHVLERYPGIESVKKVDGFFDKLTYPVAGETLTLDAIEGRGRDLGDARIHFAVVCASTSCPDLRGEPFVGSRLDAQLAEQTRAFLSDRSKGLLYDAKGNDAHLSSIFKWYAGDFTGGSTVVAFFARGGVLDWVIEHAPKEIAATLKDKKPSVSYLDYDWGLNDRK